jgi:hypothetical protein
MVKVDVKAVPAKVLLAGATFCMNTAVSNPMHMQLVCTSPAERGSHQGPGTSTCIHCVETQHQVQGCSLLCLTMPQEGSPRPVQSPVRATCCGGPDMTQTSQILLTLRGKGGEGGKGAQRYQTRATRLICLRQISQAQLSQDDDVWMITGDTAAVKQHSTASKQCTSGRHFCRLILCNTPSITKAMYYSR